MTKAAETLLKNSKLLVDGLFLLKVSKSSTDVEILKNLRRIAQENNDIIDTAFIKSSK